MQIKKHLLLSLLASVMMIHGFSQGKIENLKIIWPEEYQWKVGSNQENEQVHLMELIPGKESIDNWSIIGTMMSIKGLKTVSAEQMMNNLFKQSQQSSDNVKLTEIERDTTAGHKWILFKMEASSFKDDKKPESQLYYVLQGETSLYVNIVAIKEKKLKKDFVEKWSAVFKKSELIYE